MPSGLSARRYWAPKNSICRLLLILFAEVELEFIIRRCQIGDEARLSLLGKATFLETYAETTNAADLLDFVEGKHSVERYRSWLESNFAQIWAAEPSVGRSAIRRRPPRQFIKCVFTNEICHLGRGVRAYNIQHGITSLGIGHFYRLRVFRQSGLLPVCP
jgi:hypothetical protein